MHDFWMKQALVLADQAAWISTPNPRVGCVLVNAQGELIGEGFTQKVGQAHAEVMALNNAKARGISTQGATAYVTLEPCSHQGRTGPCAKALIEAGIARVVLAVVDPNPLVKGQGIAMLKAAGVEVVQGILEAEARQMNAGFFSRIERGRPWVRLKVATSLDGKTALPNGQSQWITGVAAREDGHQWRARACAVLTGVGTIVYDDPKLDVRLPNATRQPTLVILDTHGKTSSHAQALQAKRPVWIYTANPKHSLVSSKEVTVTQVPLDAKGRLDLNTVLSDLAQRQINELHVEAGPRLLGSLIEQSLADELVLYLAPKLLGQGLPMADWGPLADLKAARQLKIRSIEPVGEDWRVCAGFGL